MLKRCCAFALLTVTTAMVSSASTKVGLTDSLSSNSAVDSQIKKLAANYKVIDVDGVGKHESRVYADSVLNVMGKFYYDQFRHFSDPAAPYFLFMSKDAQLAMGIGGCVRMRGWYDWGGAIDANGFAPYLIQTEVDPVKMRRFATTPAGTALYFRVIGRNKTVGDYQLYIEANFNGYQQTGFNLKKAYAVINDWTVGYAESTFSDLASVAPTVDASGPNNKMSKTSVLVRWMHTINVRWIVAASAETPSSSVDQVEGLTKKVSDWMPDFAVFGQYSWGVSQHVRLAGIVRTLGYRNLLEQKNHTLAGWGVQLSTVFHPRYAWTLYGNVNGGAGYAGLGGDLQIGRYDLVADPECPGYEYAPYVWGWNLGVQYNFKPNLFVCATVAESRYLPEHKAAGSDYKKGLYAAANVFWNLTPRIQFGAEYDFGRRVNVDGSARNAQRVGALVQFSF